jgi:hypothetical protein
MPQKTTRRYGLTYAVYERGDSPWTILIKQDEKSEVYVPIYRVSWEDGGDAVIFTLLPPAEFSDREFLHIRISTKARNNDGVPGVPNPAVSVQAHVPVFTLIEPEHQRVVIQLLCVIEVEGQRLKITPTFPDPWW